MTKLTVPFWQSAAVGGVCGSYANLCGHLLGWSDTKVIVVAGLLGLITSFILPARWSWS